MQKSHEWIIWYNDIIFRVDWPPRYNWNIVERRAKHHRHNHSFKIMYKFCFTVTQTCNVYVDYDLPIASHVLIMIGTSVIQCIMLTVSCDCLIMWLSQCMIYVNFKFRNYTWRVGFNIICISAEVSVLKLVRYFASLCSEDILCSSIVVVSFIGGVNWSTRRKSPTCPKSLTNLIT
jgi:hypothetical protein